MSDQFNVEEDLEKSKQESILLIEDDKDLVYVYKDAFETLSSNSNIEACLDGEKALATVNSKKFDLIVLDRELPNIDGIDLLKKMRTEGCVNKNTPVIYASGYHFDSKDLELLDNIYILKKPFEMNSLLYYSKVAMISKAS